MLSVKFLCIHFQRNLYREYLHSSWWKKKTYNTSRKEQFMTIIKTGYILGDTWWFQRHILCITTKCFQIPLIQFHHLRLYLWLNTQVELWRKLRAAIWARTHHTDWMPSLHHHSDLVAMKSAFISALCWQTPLGTWTKHKQTGHKQLLLLLLVTWVNASLHMLVIQREREETKLH